MSFRTQKTPIVTAVAQSFVMQALHKKAAAIFCDTLIDERVRHAVAAIFKAVVLGHTQAATLELGDRCGAQGLFEVNQLSAMQVNGRGVAIAEGDTLGLAIRLAAELLLPRYAAPGAADSNSLLAKHEAGLFDEMRELLASLSSHRSSEYDRRILPHSLDLVKAIGHRMAYDAAVATDVDLPLINLYVASCIKSDAAWYVEKLGISRLKQREMENQAVDAVYARLEQYLAKMDVEPYITAAIVSDESWTAYVNSLPSHGRIPNFSRNVLGDGDDRVLDQRSGVAPGTLKILVTKSKL